MIALRAARLGRRLQQQPLPGLCRPANVDTDGAGRLVSTSLGRQIAGRRFDAPNASPVERSPDQLPIDVELLRNLLLTRIWMLRLIGPYPICSGCHDGDRHLHLVELALKKVGPKRGSEQGGCAEPRAVWAVVETKAFFRCVISWEGITMSDHDREGEYLVLNDDTDNDTQQIRYLIETYELNAYDALDLYDRAGRDLGRADELARLRRAHTDALPQPQPGMDDIDQPVSDGREDCANDDAAGGHEANDSAA